MSTTDKLPSRKLPRLLMFMAPVLGLIIVCEGVMVADMARMMRASFRQEADYQKLLDDSLARERAGLAREAKLRGMLWEPR